MAPPHREQHEGETEGPAFQTIAGVEAAVFLRELPERQIRLSLRSKGKVNVSAIAARLGGGGHENAAGVTLDGPLNRALEVILAELQLSLAGLAFAENATEPGAWEDRESANLE
jgi:phosphoesterase RecJ-like protein